MSLFTLYAGAGVLIFALALYRLVTASHLLRNVLALNVMGAGVFLFLVAIAHRNDPASPDPVAQAMVLTGIVVAVSLTAFAVALVLRIHAATGEAVLPGDPGGPDDEGGGAG